MAIQTALEELSSFLGQRLSRSKSDLEQHGASETHFPLTPPDAVVYPRTAEEVSEIVKICARNGCPVVGWGAGTSLEGQAQAFSGGISVDFREMNKILRLSPEDMDVSVQPGITREELNTDLRATGLFFPVDPGANASIGGMASTRASGTTAVRYGTMRDNVLGLQVVTADGRIIRTGTRARKSSAGYDLTGMFVGAEGTLGLITELTLRLRGQPEAITASALADGADVLTVEGLARPDGSLHPIQQAFIDEFAFQCGFCTPGMIMATKVLLDENPDPTDDEIIHHMDGNICRCTGYVPILKAIKRASRLLKEKGK